MLEYVDCSLHSLVHLKPKNNFIVTLQSIENSNNCMMFGVGEIEATLITSCLYQDVLKLHRPDTFEVMLNIIEKSGNEIINICINDRVGMAVHSELELYNSFENQKFQIDARPSDAISLALKRNIPIQVHKKLLSGHTEAKKKMSDTSNFSEYGEVLDDLFLKTFNPDVLSEKLNKAVELEDYERAQAIKRALDEKNRQK